MKWLNTFDAGTNGAGMTTSNTAGSGNAFTAVESALTFSNAHANTGTLSAKLASVAGSSYGRVAIADRNVAGRFYVWFDAAHTADFMLWQTRISSGTTNSIATVLMDGANELRLRTGADGVNIWTAADSFPLNQWVRIEILQKQGVAANDGQLRIAYYLGESSTPIEISPWFTGLNLRGTEGATGAVYLAKVSGNTYAGNAYMDTVAINTGTDYADFIGPNVLPNVAPVANAGLDQFVQAGATVTLAGSATDADGNPLTYSWAFLWPSSGAPALIGTTTATPSFVAGPLGSVYTLQLTVSDGVATATDRVNVAVTPELGDQTEKIWSGTAWI
jgi:hypothetical protein